jgi:CYTH domain-containing protein
MRVARRFLLNSSVARMIIRERPASRFVEGHFPPSHNRLSYVLFESDTCMLVLVSNPRSPEAEEERTEVPASQGQFLLEVCGGTLAYYRAICPMDNGRDAVICSFSVPGPLQMVEIEFDDQLQADQFVAPIWFGREVSGDSSFDHTSIARHGLPGQQALEISDDAVHALLDFLDGTAASQSTSSKGEVPSGVQPFRRAVAGAGR